MLNLMEKLKKMTLTFGTDLIDACCRLGITPNELALYYILNSKNTAKAYKFVEEVGMFEHSEFDTLIEKSYILPVNNETSLPSEGGDFVIIDYFMDSFVTTGVLEDQIENLIAIEGEELFEQVYNSYPSHVVINNTGGKGIAKGITSWDDTKKTYLNAIKMRKELHENVLLHIEQMKEKYNGLAICNFVKYVNGRVWNVPIEDEHFDFTRDI
jgi:hypothetical protein